MKRLLLLGLFCSFSIAALGQKAPLTEFEWTQWLVGEWEGTAEGPSGTVPMTQSFRYTLEDQYILTNVRFGEGENAFTGFGVFQYFPKADSAFGDFFGVDGLKNNGWGKYYENKVVWHLRRGLRTTTRIRERVSDNEYVVYNYSVTADGRRYESVERLKRKAKGGAD